MEKNTLKADTPEQERNLAHAMIGYTRVVSRQQTPNSRYECEAFVWQMAERALQGFVLLDSYGAFGNAQEWRSLHGTIPTSLALEEHIYVTVNRMVSSAIIDIDAFYRHSTGEDVQYAEDKGWMPKPRATETWTEKQNEAAYKRATVRAMLERMAIETFIKPARRFTKTGKEVLGFGSDRAINLLNYIWQ